MRSISSSRGRSIASCAAAAAVVVSLTACGAPQQPYASQPYPVQSTQQVYPAAQNNYVEYGRVSQIEVMRVEEKPKTSGAGAIIGGVAGAVIGHQIGGGFGRDAATVVGAVGGAVVGNSVEKNRKPGDTHDVYRVSVQLERGEYRSFEVSGGIDLRVGDRVRIENGQLFRS